MLLILSYPFMGTSIQRGNSVLLVSVLLTISFAWYDSSSKVKQEIAMILIAVAAGFKAYPAICGLQYVKDRQYKKIFRIICYGLALFFGPFLFFGGVIGMKQLFSLYALREAEIPHAGTIRGVTYFLLTELTTLSADNVMGVSIFFECMFLIISIFCIFITKIRWKEILFLTGILAVYIPVNNMYTSVYLLPALFMFLKENNFIIRIKGNATNFISCILFAMIFSLPFYLIKFIPFGIYPCVFFLIFILLFLNIAEVIALWYKQRRIIGGIK